MNSDRLRNAILLLPRPECETDVTLPSPRRIEPPLLAAIAAGGEVSIRDGTIYLQVARYFSEITDEDLAMPHSSSSTAWESRVQWARLNLVHRGELFEWRDVGKQGIWRITEKGLERVKRENIQPIAETRVAEEEPTEEQRRVHAEVQQQLEDIGRILGKYARQEFRQDTYRYDVIWKDAERIPRATHAFEVQHRGNLVEALGKLKHAYDIWHSYLFVVITSERDRRRAEQLLQPYFSGMFHEIGDQVNVLTAEDVFEIHSALAKHGNTFKAFLVANGLHPSMRILHFSDLHIGVEN